MKNNDSTINLLILLAMAVIAFVMLWKKSNSNSQRMATVISMKDDTLQIWKDNAGRWRTEAVTARVTNSEMKKFFAAESEQVRRDFDIKLKNVTTYLKATTHTSQTITMPVDSTITVMVKAPDGSDSARYNYNDQWATIAATLRSHQLSIRYRVRDSLSFVSHWKSQGLFRPPLLKLDGISYNPNTQITGLRNIQITVPARRISAGIFAGYGFVLGEKFGIVAGIGVQYRLIGR